MWRESYSLGVELIDKQHKELFKMVEHLIEVIQNGRGDKKKECIAAVLYMKDYTLQHFHDEEDYQKSINYSAFDEHRDIHKKFTKVVLHHEQKMIESDFEEKYIKDFMGTLIAWLVYHVAGTDQQIKSGKCRQYVFKRNSPVGKYFNVSTCHTLNKLTRKNVISIPAAEHTIDDLQSAVAVKMNLCGVVSGKITFKYTKKLALELIKNMAGFTPQNLDEIVCSAMSEISNIIGSNATQMMKSSGISCRTNIPAVQIHPAFLTSEKGIIFDTGMGILEITAAIDA